MNHVRWIAVVITALLLALPGQAQRKNKKPRELELGAGKNYRCAALNVEFKVPTKCIPANKGGLPANVKAFFQFKKHNYTIEVGQTQAGKLEDLRESIVKDLERNHPAATYSIVRGKIYGGLKSLTIFISGIANARGRNYIIYNAVDVPVKGIVRVLITGPKKEVAQVKKLSDWLMPTFRLSGEEGDDLLFERRVVDVGSGLSYRVPIGAVPSKTATPGILFEGQAPGGAYVKVAAPPAAGEASLGSLLKDWASGAPAKNKPHAVATRASGGEAKCALFDRYGGRPERAICAYRPNDSSVFHIEVTGSKMPMLHLERMVSVLEWVDIPAQEKKVSGWRSQVEEAIKAKDERTLKKIARRLPDRYYLKSAMELARLILIKGAPEKAQIYVLRCIEQGGTPDTDFVYVKKALTSSKYRDRVKMRVKAVEALAALEALKCTNYLIQVMRDKETKVAKAAILALGRHKANRKKSIPILIRQYNQVLTEGKSKNPKKKLRLSRLGDAFREALRDLTGTDIKDVDAAKDWLRANKKFLMKEELKK